MQLSGVYDFLELKQHDGVDVWKAREKSSGKLVQIHLYPSAQQDTANEICELLIGLTTEARSKVLKFGPVRDATCFVTELLPEGESLHHWMAVQTAPQPPASEPRVRAGMIGNLKKLDIEPAAVAPMPPPQKLPPAPVRAELRATTSEPQPGAFTKLYSARELQETMQAAPPPAPTPPALPAADRPNTTDKWAQLYGTADARSFEPRMPAAPPPEPEPLLRSKPTNSLESFIFKQSDLVAPAAPELLQPPLMAERTAPPIPLPPPMPEPPPMVVRRHGPPPPVQQPQSLQQSQALQHSQAVAPPLFDLPAVPTPDSLPALPAMDLPGSHTPFLSEPRVKPLPEAPAPYSNPARVSRPALAPAAPVYAAPVPPKSGASLDWKLVLMVVLIVIVAAGALVAVLETTS